MLLSKYTQKKQNSPPAAYLFELIAKRGKTLQKTARSASISIHIFNNPDKIIGF